MMRLRTFESFWLIRNGLLNSYPSLQENLKTDILVIGGGITGALVSHALLERGYRDVTLIDKGDIALGSTAATTSMLQYEIDVPLYELSEMIGEEGAAACYQAGIRALKELGKLVSRYKIDCGFEKKESLYLAHQEKAVEKLQREYQIRAKYQLGVRWLSTAQIKKSYGLQSFGGILSREAASVDAYRLAHALIAKNVKRGLKVYDQTEPDLFELNGRKPLVHLKTGQIIRCNKVIFCTGFEATRMLDEKLARLFYTYACVSEQGIKIPPGLKKTLVWDTANPYLYMRTTDDGRLLVGGEDASFYFPFFQQRTKNKKAAALISRLESLMPGLVFTEDFSWAGVFGSTKDGLPYIGKSPEYKNALFVLGFGGNGITFSVQAMEIIPDLLRGKKHPLAEYYRFGR